MEVHVLSAADRPITTLANYSENCYLVHDAGAGGETLRPEPELAPEVVRHDLVRELLAELPRGAAPGTLQLVQHPDVTTISWWMDN